jgi:C-terminal peptidase prc
MLELTTRPSPPRRAASARTWRLWVLLLSVVAAMACKRATEPPRATSAHAAIAAPAPTQASAPSSAAATEATQVAVNGDGAVRGKERAVAREPVADDDDGDGEDDERDYWKGVKFDETNFEEVLDYVGVEYIDAQPDVRRAWIEAANFALMTLEPPEELLPQSFYDVRKGHVDEEGRLDGKTSPFACKGTPLAGILLHHVPDAEYLKAKRPKRKKGRLSDEEVLALRAKVKSRNELYENAWKQLPFDRAKFNCVMAYAEKRVSELQAEAKAKKASASKGAKADAKSAAVALAPTADRSAQGQAEAATPQPALDPVVQQGAVAAAGSDKKQAPAAGNQDAKKDAAKAAADGKDGDDKDKPRPLPDSHRVWEAATQGYLYALDPHSSVIPRRAWDDSTDKTQDSSFEGIGAVLTQRDDQTIIENPMEGRPAWRAGLRAGDVIHKVNGTDVSGLALNKVVKMIRGPRNTKVVLTVSRETDPDPKDYSITRENIEMKNVDGKLLPDDPSVGYVKMTGFIPQSTRDLRAMIDKLSGQAPGGKLRGLVLDLRNNSGGLLSKAIEIADAFLSKGRIVSVKSRKKSEEVHSATASGSDYTFPLVVLVNDGAASASEIVASALRDNGRGLVLGTRTFGKASVQTLFEPQLHFDYYIKLTVARYYGPAGNTIQVVGVPPDVEVAPHVDGKMPLGYREENLNNHLTPLQGAAPSPWAPLLPELNACVDKTGSALAIAKRDPKPQIQPDFQLLRAADYIRCLAQRPKPTAR